MPKPPDTLRALAEKHDVWVASDNSFQRRARLLQALWREEQGLRCGEHRGRPLGSRLAMPEAEEGLLNYLTDTIRAVVDWEVCNPGRDPEKLYGQPRIFNDLLSSQPLCFNLFGELKADRKLATRAFRALTQGQVAEVTRIEFEHSPGRGDRRYTEDRSAFDVYVEYLGPEGARGFVGIEVKYHEGLGDPPADHRGRYDEIADDRGWFKTEKRAALKGKPLQQIWRDHLLAGSLLMDREAGFDDGCFVFLYPKDNVRCAEAVEQYRGCLTSEESFAAWTLEEVVGALKDAGAGKWVHVLADRYLGFEKIGLG